MSIAPLPGLIPGVNFDVSDKLPVKAGGHLHAPRVDHHRKRG